MRNASMRTVSPHTKDISLILFSFQPWEVLPAFAIFSRAPLEYKWDDLTAIAEESWTRHPDSVHKGTHAVQLAASVQQVDRQKRMHGKLHSI